MSTQWYFFEVEENGQHNVKQYSSDGVCQQTFENASVRTLKYNVYKNGKYVYETLPCYELKTDDGYMLYSESGDLLLTSTGTFWAVSETQVQINLGEEEKYGVYDLLTGEVREESYHPDENERESYVLSQNGVSKLCGVDLYVSESFERIELRDADTNLIDEADALSLVKNGFYKYGTMEESDGEWEKQLVAVKLKKIGSEEFSCPEYDDMGVLSDGRIAYLDDGKWGYLELKVK